MGDFLRIRTANNLRAEETPDDYKQRLLKLIPGEAVTAYATSANLITQQMGGDQRFAWLVVVFVLALLLLLLVRYNQTRDLQSGRPQWGNILISSISYVIYVYTLGGLFLHYPGEVLGGWSAVGGAVVAIFWTAFLPEVGKLLEEKPTPPTA